MQITHEQARRWIQFEADRTLEPTQKVQLSGHLKQCPACQSYAEQVHELERILHPLLQRQWGRSPIPHTAAVLRKKRMAPRSTSSMLAMRKTMISVLCAALLFGTWQFLLARAPMTGILQVGAPPVPTPSMTTTSTHALGADCKMIRYTVQRGDTLSSVAQRFGRSDEELMALNALNSTVLRADMTVIIPVCDFTPTAVETLATLTGTDVPVAQPLTQTPGAGSSY